MKNDIPQTTGEIILFACIGVFLIALILAMIFFVPQFICQLLVKAGV